MSVAFADLVIEECTFDGTDKGRSVIEVSECHDRDSPGPVTLRSVAFRKNRLAGASGLRMSEPSCSELEMIDVEIANNVCSGDGCGAFLAKKSILENCTATKNKVAESNKNSSSLLFVPASSTTTIRGLAASRNDHTVIRVQDRGVLSLSNTTFNRNSLKSQQAKKMKASCVHSVKSSVEISKCNFTANKGFRGTVILAQKSDISVSGSVFRYNVGLENGGCIYATRSKVILEDTTATKSRAASHGGFMYTEKSKVRLKNTTAIESSSDFGGFMFAYVSEVTIENTTAFKSSSDFGGFMSAQTSVVTIENTTANKSSAEFGGFMHVVDSTVKLKNTTATNSSAQNDGGFMWASWDSTVKLENTAATNSSAQNDGGFMYARDSTVKLKNTAATNSSAQNDGGFICVVDSTVKLENTTATNISAQNDGGFMYLQRSQLRIVHSHFTWSKSKISGGFALLKNSSVWINDSELAQGSSKKGGAIWMKKSKLTAHNLSVNHFQAQNDGGGVMGIASSTFSCTNCTFKNNSAKKGDGGAIFFDSNRKQRLSLQLVGSRIENNTANLGGKTCKKEWNECF